MTAKGFVQSLDLANKCSPQTFMAPQAAKNLSVRLNTCLNTSFLVSTPADQHLSPRLNTWLLDAESCLTGEGAPTWKNDLLLLMLIRQWRVAPCA